MKIQFYNSLTHRLEEFQPLTPGIVRMYGCGPTVYDYAHIGNFRTFLFSDLLRRFLEFTGLEVRHVMNITDVGHMTDDANADGAGQDRMQAAAVRIREDKKTGKVPAGAIENPSDPYQIAQFYTDVFLEDARQLGYKVAFEYPQRMPKATDHVPGMIEMIKRLIERGHAYVASDGVVYFDVQSFPRYGELSGNSLDKLQSGAGGRVTDENQLRKRHPADFMLWKPDASHIMKWDSPWGAGYPGWHIECSVMATQLLESPVIDIHTGGEDLIFPHHECEIAQTCGATGKDLFARFWIHSRFLLVEGEKMSKRNGTFFTVRDVLEGKVAGRPVDPAVLRLELIKSHYRSNLNFTTKGLSDSAVIVRRLTEFRQRLEQKTNGVAGDVDLTHPVLAEFAAALADDLNIAGALGVVLPWASSEPADPREALGIWKKMNSVLAIAPIHEGLKYSATQTIGGDDAFTQAIQWGREVDAARASKQFDNADAIRKKIIDAGFEVRTTKEGTVVQKPLA